MKSLLGFVLRASLALLVAESAHASVSIYVAYAENERTPLYFPDPWLGSPKTTFLGYPGPSWDTGAILILNTGATNVVLSQGAKVSGFGDGSSYQLWDNLIGPSGVTIAPGQQVILAQTGALATTNPNPPYSPNPCVRSASSLCYSNFDTSDTPLNHPMVPAQPVIQLTLNGVTQTWTDTAQVLNTGGFDYGDDYTLNESEQWRLVGTTGPTVPAGTGVPAIVTPFDVTTQHDDSQRTGLDNVESILTPARVASGAFAKLNTVALAGHVDAQPLVVSAATLASMGYASTYPNDVVYVADELNNVYAIDGVTGAILKQRNFGTPVAQANLPGGCGNNPATVGINSTPVIDPVNQVMYLLAYDATATGVAYQVHKINLLDLSDNVAPVTAAASGTLSDGTTVSFQAAYQRQRPGLLLSGGTLYAGFGSWCDVASNYSRGWILGWNAATLTALPASALMEQQTAAQIGGGIATTQVGVVDFLASIWQSGFGIAADPSGNVYAQTGNSSGIIANNYPDSVVKVSPTLSAVSDYFTPANFATLDYLDEDRGSTGVLVVPNQASGLQFAVAPAKDGRMFLLNRNNLGKFVANGPDVPPYVTTGGCWCSPDYYVGSDGQSRIALSGGTQVQTWTLPTSASGNLAADATGVPVPTGAGDPGFMSSVSTFGTLANSGVIWGTSRALNGRIYLQALDATNGAGGASQTLDGTNNAVTDKAGNVWSFSTAERNTGEHNVLINGTASIAWAVKIVIGNDGNAYHLNALGQWYTPNGSGGWTQLATPPNAHQPSQAGTTIMPATGGALTDVTGNVWSFGSVVRNPGEYNQLYNGVPLPGTYAVKMVVASNGTVWSNNYQNQWYTYNGSTWTQQTSGPPTYLPSRFGSTIIPAYGGSVTDAAGRVWSYGSVNADGVDYNILLNGAATIASGTQISIDNTGTMWQANSQGAWYTYNGTTWSQGAGAPNLFAPNVGSYVTPAAAGELRELQLVDTGAWALPASNANAVPVVANGRVYVASTNALTIWGILGVTTVEAPAATPTQTAQSQTINFPAIAAQASGTTLALTATASSGLPVTYSASTTGVCTVSGTTATLLAAGTCTITASQAGNATYAAATSVSQNFTVTAASAPVGVTLAPVTLAQGNYNAFTVSITGASTAPTTLGLGGIPCVNIPGCIVDLVGSGIPLNFEFSGVSNASASLGIFVSTSVTPGTYAIPITIGTTKVGTLALTVPQLAQTITFGAIAAQTAGTQLSLAASASSGLAVSYASASPSVCTVSGSTASFVGAGTCTITASQTGNITYAAATSVSQSFSVAGPSAGGFTLTPAATKVTVTPPQCVFIFCTPAVPVTDAIAVASTGGFTGAVTFSIAGLPAGVTATFGPASIATKGSTTLTLTPSSSAASGQSTKLTITGTSGSKSAVTTITLSY
jgi:hypothetical protein